MDCLGCDVCRFALAGELYGDVDGKHLCYGCWRKAGRPWPRLERTALEIHEAETQVRKRMIQRGGEDRYRALSGKA